MRNFIGKKIHSYQILLIIRETPSRILYRAYDEISHKFVAVDIVKKENVDPPRLLEQLNEQITKNNKLKHDNIAVVKDLGILDEFIYIVYDFYPKDFLRRYFNQTYSWSELTREFVPVAHALAYSHKMGVAHGNISPLNIILDENRNPVLFDFGIEYAITSHKRSQISGAWIERWEDDYLSPERRKGSAPDYQSDIYAFGVMMMEWAFGRRPSQNVVDDSFSLLHKSRTSNNQGTATELALQDMILKCVTSNREEQYRSMDDVFYLLWNGTLGASISKQLIRSPQRVNTGKKFGYRSFAFMLLTAMLLGVSFWYFVDSSKSNPEIVSSPLITDIVAKTGTPNITASKTPTPLITATTLPIQTVDVSSPSLPYILPAFQGTPVPSSDQTIALDNMNNMAVFAQWGMGNLEDIAVSPDGTSVAVASSIGILIFDSQDLHVVNYIETLSSVNSVKYSPDGRILFAGYDDGLIQFWSTTDLQEPPALLHGHVNAVIDLSFSSDGARLVSVSHDGLLLLWNTRNWQKLVEASVPKAVAVSFSTDDTYLVVGGSDFSLKIFNADDLTLIDKIDFSSQIVDIASGGSDWFVVGGADRRVSILTIGDEAVVKPVGTLEQPLASVAASPDGVLVAAGDIYGGVSIWDRREGGKRQVIPPYIERSFALDSGKRQNSISFGADANVIYSGLHDGVVRVFDVLDGVQVAQNSLYNAHAEKLYISHDGRYVLTQQKGGVLNVWDIRSGTPLYQLFGSIMDGDPFSADNSLFAFASNNANVKVYETVSGKEVYNLVTSDEIKTIHFIDNGSKLVVGNSPNIHLWSMSSGQEIKIKKNFVGRNCPTIADLNNRSLFLLTSYHYVIDVRANNNIGLCNFVPSNRVYDVDDALGLLAYGRRGELAIDNVQQVNGAHRAMEGVDLKSVVSITLHNSGELLAVALDDNLVHVWDLNTRREIYSWYIESVSQIRFTPDGNFLVSTSDDGILRYWGIIGR